MRCSVCGVAHDPGDRFCRACGRRFPYQAVPAKPVRTSGSANPPDEQKDRRLTVRLRILAAAVVALALLLVVLAQAAPDLIKLAGFKPEDLGVTWTEQDYANAMEKCKVTFDAPPSGADRSKCSIEYLGNQEADWSLTESEITALLDGGEKPGYWPVSSMQVKLHGDNVVEVACVLDPAKLLTYPVVTRFLPQEVLSYINGIPLKIPVKAKARVTAAGPKQIDVALESFSASGISLAGTVMNDQADLILESIAAAMLEEAGPVTIDTLESSEGVLHFTGTWFTKLRRSEDNKGMDERRQTMKKILMFTMESCPYCVRARRWMAETLKEHPEYQAIPIEYVDEMEQPKLADSYDYWYVPTYYVDGVKVHEGAATKEIVLGVFKKAFEG